MHVKRLVYTWCSFTPPLALDEYFTNADMSSRNTLLDDEMSLATYRVNKSDTQVVRDTKAVAVLRDRALNGAAIAIAVLLGLLLIAFIVFGAIALAHWWTTPSSSAGAVTYNSTAAKTVVTLSLIAQDVWSGCPYALDSNCSLATAIETSSGAIMLRTSPSTVVGIVTTTCITIGELVVGEGVDAQCNSYYAFNGEGSIEPGVVTTQGLVKRYGSVNATATTDTVAVTGGTGYYINPSGGIVTLTNRSLDEMYVDMSITLVN